MIYFTALQHQCKLFTENIYIITEGAFRFGELVLPIFSFMEAANKTIPAALNKRVNTLSNFVGIYRSLFLLNCTRSWFNKNKYNESFYQAEYWQSVAQLVCITALTILDIPNFLARFNIKHPLLSISFLGRFPILPELGCSFFGAWESVHEIGRIEKKEHHIGLVKKSWKALQKKDIPTFDTTIPTLILSTQNLYIEVPQDQRDKQSIKKEIKQLAQLHSDVQDDPTAEELATKKVKQWGDLTSNLKLAKKIVYAILGIHIASFMMVILIVISYSRSSVILRFGIPTMELMNGIFGMRFYLAKCAYRHVNTLDYEEYR